MATASAAPAARRENCTRRTELGGRSIPRANRVAGHAIRAYVCGSHVQREQGATVSDVTNFDPAAVAAYTAAAAEVAALLGAAATHSETAAAADLSGLGQLGADFAASWRSAVEAQASTIRIAETVVGRHGRTLGAYGAAMTEADTGTAAALGTVEGGV